MESIRIPSVLRARFVRRALYLKTHRKFVLAIDSAVLEWNKSHAGFAISSRADDPRNPIPNDYLYPYLLKRAIDTTQGDFQSELAISASEAAVEWRQLVDRLCMEWWPEKYYPDWTGSITHPATRFISACLVSSPLRVPEEWIRQSGIGGGLLITRHDPENPHHRLEALEKQDLWRIFNEHLVRLLESQGSITKEDISGIVDQVWAEAFEAMCHRSLRATPRYWVPVFPGMTDVDWKAMRSSVKSLLDKPRNGGKLQDHIVHLVNQEGMSVNAVANLLGMDRTSVNRFLKIAQDDNDN